MFKHVLIPVDFTSKNAAAISVASELAQQYGTEVTLLHVIETVENIPAKEMKGFYEQLERKASRNISKLRKTYFSARRGSHVSVIYGKRANEIVKFATKNSVDLIVMSSHKPNLNNPSREFGTISHLVAIIAPCAVLLVK
jgi:nucleotide-binding universal stress UspA family protein